MNMDILILPELRAAAEAIDKYLVLGHVKLETPKGHALDMQITRANYEGSMKLIKAALFNDLGSSE